MSRRSVLAVAFLGLLAVCRGDEKDPTKVPRGPAPQRIVVADVETGDAIFTARLTVPVNLVVYEQQTVMRDGVPVKVVVPKNRTVDQVVVVRHNVGDFEFTTPDGKKLTREDVLKRMKKGDTLVISADGKPVDPRHLQGIKGDVLILLRVPQVEPGK